MATAARRAAWNRQRADTQDSQLMRAVRRENTRVHRVCNDAFERFHERHVQGKEKDLRQRDQKGLFQCCKSLKIEDTWKVSSQYIRDEEGIMLRDPGSILGRWARVFGTLLNSKSDKLRLDIIEELPLWPIAHDLGVGPTESELIGALRSMENAKAVGPDELPVELLKLGINHDPTVLRAFHRVIKLVWHQREVPQRWQDAVIRFCTTRRTGQSSAVTIVAFPSWHTRVRSFSRSSLRNSAPTSRRGTCCRKSSVGSAHTVRRRI